MRQLVTTRSGLELWTETFGRATDPAMLLVMGATAQGIVWPDALCRSLADSGYRVVRYDHRDTGQSSSVDFAAAPYDVSDLAADAADVIVSLDLGPTHVVGLSVGGMVAQLVALTAPALVRSLVLLSSSPDANGDVHRAPSSGLPAPHQPMLDHVAWISRNPSASALDVAVRGWKVLVGPGAPFDEVYWHDVVTRSHARARCPQSAGNHLVALDRTPSLLDRLGSLRVPTLVVHGTNDHVLPIEHGRALAGAIPGARLVEVPGLGHTFPPEWIDRLHALIASFVGSAASDQREVQECGEFVHGGPH
jgi:pimeloyl-ACP methyl ester carboxylesterase